MDATLYWVSDRKKVLVLEVLMVVGMGELLVEVLMVDGMLVLVLGLLLRRLGVLHCQPLHATGLHPLAQRRHLLER